ncbi:MAG: class I SAM-dependent methyltransferase, partial [Candidatus Methanomethylicia archaeon]
KYKIKDINLLFDYIKKLNLFGIEISPIQDKKEFLELLKIVKKTSPKNILEIGTAMGGSLFLFTRVAPKNSKIISIDLPGGPYGGGYPKWKIPIYKSFLKNGQKIFLIRSDSHKKSTYKKVKKILKGNYIDFLFIDGDHTYEGVKKDFLMYRKLVKKGIIAFHDISEHDPDKKCYVKKFWDEIKYQYKYKEIINNSLKKWGGIGIIFIN